MVGVSRVMVLTGNEASTELYSYIHASEPGCDRVAHVQFATAQSYGSAP